ncbi:hypothetical protein ACFIOY_04140 [Bradyrhizobium sp. TZ2]
MSRSFGARQITFDLASIDFHLIQRAALLGVILAAEDLAGLDHLSLASAKLDQPAALQRHHLGPALGLDGACSVNGFGNRREARDAGGHQRWMKEMGIGVIASPCRGDGQNSGCDEMLQFHGASCELEAKPLAQARWSLVEQITNIISFAFFAGGADATLGDAGNTAMLDGAGCETADDGGAAGAGCTTAGAGAGVAGAG